MVSRTFFMVGNGLFVEEQADDMVNIYDCGGQSKKVIEEAVLRFINKKRRHIDNLFISHYDRDHINGILSLLSTCDCDRIFLPMIHPIVRVVDYVQHPYDYHYSDFIFNPEEFIRRITNNVDIINVNEDEPVGNRVILSARDNNDAANEVNAIPQEGSTHSINNGCSCVFRDWLFRVFNRRVMSANELANFMNRLGLDVNASLDDVIGALRNQNNDLKTALKRVFSPMELKLINDYSMTVWSGPATLDERNGCLFTGDYNAKINMPQLSAVYGNLKNRTKIVQIPHHGSSYNFNLALCDSAFEHALSSSAGPYKSRRIVNPTSTIDLLKANGFSHKTTFAGDLII